MCASILCKVQYPAIFTAPALPYCKLDPPLEVEFVGSTGYDSRSKLSWPHTLKSRAGMSIFSLLLLQACLDYVLTLGGLHINKGRITTAGVSMGGYGIATSLHPIESAVSIFESAFNANQRI